MLNLYKQLRNDVQAIHQLFDTMQKSDNLIEYFEKFIHFYVYSSLVLLFFSSLRRENIGKFGLPSGKINQIKLHFDTVYQQIVTANKVLTLENIRLIDDKFYETFKNDLKINFPKFIKIVTLIEKENGYSKIVSFLLKEKKLLKEYNNENIDILSLISTKKFEVALRNGKFNLNKKEEANFSASLKDMIKHSVMHGVDNLKESSVLTLKEHEEYERGFNNRLYIKWKKPLDLLKLLIISSSEIGVGKIRSFGRQYRNGKITNIKELTLIRINARCIQVANEIFCLIKNGYADAANGRWRTLYELTAIFMLISNNSDDVARRYLEHQSIKKYKQANEFKNYHKKLGYSFSTSNYRKLETEYNRLLAIHGKEFKEDYGWISRSILKDQNFKGLARILDIDQYLPFYDESNNQLHGGSKGLHRLGLVQKQQKEVLLTGPTDFGLADPIQNTVYCLMVINATYLDSKFNIENKLKLNVLHKFTKDIGPEAVTIQKELKHLILENIKDEKSTIQHANLIDTLK